MSNIINNLLLNETATPITNSSDQSVKEAPSLFDSLLSTATSSKEISTENNTSVNTNNSELTEVRTEDLNVEVTKNTNTLSKEVETTKADSVAQENNDKVTKNTTNSLLDRLLIEAKNDVSKENLITTMNSTLTLKSDTQTGVLNDVNTKDSLLNKIADAVVEVEDVKVDVAKVDVSTDKKEEVKVDISSQTQELNKIVNINVEEKKEESQQVVNNSTSSLLDKLVIEAKKDIDKTNTKDSLLNKIADTVVVAEDVKVDVAKVDVSTDKKEEVKVDISSQTQELNKIVNINVEEKKEESQQVVNNSTSSLLDKLVIEAKKDIDKTNTKDSLLNKIADTVVVAEDVKVDVAKVDVSTDKKEEVKVDISSQTQELNKIVNINVEEKKEESQQVVNNSTSSLLDKLVIEAKKDIDKTNTKDSLLNKIADTVVVAEDVKVDVAKIDVSTDKKVDIPENIANPIVLDNVETVVVNENEGLSLMDKLIQKTTEKIITTDTKNVVTETFTKETASEDLITNIYLGSQKNQLNNQSLFNKKEAVTLLKEGTNVQAIKVSAEMLELGLEDIDVQQTKDDKVEIKKTTIDIVDRKNIIDSILSQKNVKSEEVKNLITQSVEASKALLGNELTLAEDSVVNVNSPLSYNIQSKIIGAKQQMATMMSDIAKQMYENYKPPVTAFRINLNPTELGSIAILMKSDKNSGLSISLNASNSVTLDTLMENQNVLKNSLSKTFSENTKFNLDFSSSNENNNQSSNNQSNQQNNRRFEQQIDTQSILKLQEENKNIEEKILDYM